MDDMQQMDTFNLLPDPARWIWIILFIAIFALHVAHAVQMRGVHRLWHTGHMVMAIGMVYMFIPPRFLNGWAWPWVGVFGVVSGLALLFAVREYRRGRRVDLPWITLTAGLALMAYMWLMMGGLGWAPLTYAATGWFLAEAVGWFTEELCGRNPRPVLPPAINPRLGPAIPLGTCSFLGGDNPIAHGTSSLGAKTLGLMAMGMGHMMVAMQMML